MLDSEKSNQFNCNTCSLKEQALRNCSGKGSPAKIMLNHNYYRRCPKAIYLENSIARYLVGVYFECREHKVYPSPGSYGQQTAFCVNLFDYLDSVVAETRIKNQKANAAKKS